MTDAHPVRLTQSGPTRVAAIADACRKAKAKEVQHGTD